MIIDLNQEEVSFEHKIIMFTITQKYIDKHSGDIYETVRCAWRLNVEKAKQAEYILALAKGEVIGVYEPEEWLPATKENFPLRHSILHKDRTGRLGFIGDEAPQDIKKIYLGLKVIKKKGDCSVVHYLPKYKW